VLPATFFYTLLQYHFLFRSGTEKYPYNNTFIHNILRYIYYTSKNHF